MKHTITYEQLYTIDADFGLIHTNNPGLALINHAKIALFYQQAAMHIEILNKKLLEIRSKYIQQDDFGNLLTQPGPTGPQWLFKQTVSDIATAQILTGDKVKAAFENECKKYTQSKSLTIIF